MNFYLYIVIVLVIIYSIQLVLLNRILGIVKEVKINTQKLFAREPEKNNNWNSEISSLKELITNSLYYNNEDGAQSRLVMIKKDINDIYNNVSDIKSILKFLENLSAEKLTETKENAVKNINHSNISNEINLSEINKKLDILINEMNQAKPSGNLPIL